MFCTTIKTPVANKPHICTSCGERIEVGEQYVRWNSVEDSWEINKMHNECYSMHRKECGYWEYTPYSHERPSKGEDNAA